MGDQDPRDYRESITLGDLKRQLRVRPVSELPHFQGLGVTDAAIEAYLMRFLRAKHLSTAEAIAKLKRRRAYETTLPTIRVTPAVVAALRSGAISILGLDNCQRPILFLDLSVFQLPTLAVDEAQRLLILLLEYMQSKCLASACNSNNSNNNDASNKNNGATPTGKYAQQFVLLVNESGSSWQGHVPIMRKASAVYSVFSKYYPMLLDLVLVCDASFEVRQGVKAALAGSPASFSKTIQLVQRSDLTRYMRADLLPPTLGGRADRRASIDGEAAQSGTDLAESVMRHWYTLTSYIQLENSSSASPSPQASGGAAAPPSPSSSPSSSSAVPARPLYVPPPFVTSAPSLACFQKNITVPSSARSSPGRITSNAIDPLAATYNSEAGSVYMRQSFKTALSNNSSMRGGTLTRDDGVCSAIFSDDEELGVLHTAFEDDEPGAADAVACAFGADAALTEEERARLQADPTLALSALEAERGRRFATEQRLRLLELGVVMDMKHATDIERQLAAIHQEINVLVADVVLKARVTQQRGGGGGGNGPSVSQLLDLTLSALERAGDVPEEVPAMSLATPAQREPSSLVCCTLM